MLELTHSESFEFDLPSALLASLTGLFEEMPSAPLTADNLAIVQEEQGVYQLFHNHELVYIGKTDSDAGLKKRLLRHCQKIQGRNNISPDDVSFKSVRIFVFTAMDLESLLIKEYKKRGHGLKWQNSGFGSNDPGRERDTTKLKEEHFDIRFPIRKDIPLSMESGEVSIGEMFYKMKNSLPYTLRFQKKGRKPHPDLMSKYVTLADGEHTVAQLLKIAAVELGREWQITMLPGYVIVYKERRAYKDGYVIE